MQGLVVLVGFALCAWTQMSQAAFPDKGLQENFGKCAQKQNLTNDDIEKLKRKENLSDERYKCLAKCVCEKEGLVKYGKYDKEAAKKMAMKMYKDDATKLKKAEDVAEECDGKLKDVSTSGCEIGPAVLGCLLAGAKEKELIKQEKKIR